MPKGAKKGENRFSKSQSALNDFRTTRINNVVIPTVKSYIGKISITGKTAYCKLCAEIFNRDLPVNEKKIGYRRIEQNLNYWSLLGPIFHRHWDPDGSVEQSRNNLISQLEARENKLLKEQLEGMESRIEALQAFIRNNGIEKTNQHSPDGSIDTLSLKNFELTCMALKTVIEASDDEFQVDKEAMKITCASNDLEPVEGLVPKEMAKPFITWLLKRAEKTGGER